MDTPRGGKTGILSRDHRHLSLELKFFHFEKVDLFSFRLRYKLPLQSAGVKIPPPASPWGNKSVRGPLSRGNKFRPGPDRTPGYIEPLIDPSFLDSACKQP